MTLPVPDRPSPHVSWAELGCHDGTPYPLLWINRALVLCHEFETIREHVGKPIVIGSAYRTEVYNRTIGGARNSQHVQGRALDLYPPKGWTVLAFHTLIRKYALSDESLIYGLGLYPTFVHIDIRPAPESDQVVCWKGSRAWAESKV